MFQSICQLWKRYQLDQWDFHYERALWAIRFPTTPSLPGKFPLEYPLRQFPQTIPTHVSFKFYVGRSCVRGKCHGLSGRNCPREAIVYQCLKHTILRSMPLFSVFKGCNQTILFNLSLCGSGWKFKKTKNSLLSPVLTFLIPRMIPLQK